MAGGANGPTTPDADLVLGKRQDEIFAFPDILCNAGRAIVSLLNGSKAFSGCSGTETEVNEQLYRLLQRAFGQVVKRTISEGIANRVAAMAIGVEKVREGKRLRGLFT